MTQEQKRIKIAEACGWELVCPPAGGFFAYWQNRDIKREDVPDYLHDLNAMHEAEKVLNEPVNMQKHAWNTYKARLENITNGSSFHATARQRAEEFLRTLGLLKERTITL